MSVKSAYVGAHGYKSYTTLWSMPDSLPLLRVVSAFPHAAPPPDSGHPGAAGTSDLMLPSASSPQLLRPP